MFFFAAFGTVMEQGIHAVKAEHVKQLPAPCLLPMYRLIHTRIPPEGSQHYTDQISFMGQKFTRQHEIVQLTTNNCHCKSWFSEYSSIKR